MLPIVPPHTDKHKHAHLGGFRTQPELHFVPATFPAASLSETTSIPDPPLYPTT